MTPGVDVASTARWVALGGLVAVVLAQLALNANGHVADSVWESRPGLPSDGSWGTWVWMLPSVPVVVAACLVPSGKRPGAALGWTLGATLWAFTNLVFVVVNHAGAKGPHWLVVILLVGSAAALVVSAPETRAPVAPNRADLALAALLLTAVAVLLRCGAAWIGPSVAEGSPRQLVVHTVLFAHTNWLSWLAPVLICVPAALLRGNLAQRRALVVVAALQVVYPLVLRSLTFAGTASSDTVPATLVGDAVFLVGSLFMVLAVRAGQPKGRARDAAPSLSG